LTSEIRRSRESGRKREINRFIREGLGCGTGCWRFGNLPFGYRAVLDAFIILNTRVFYEKTVGPSPGPFRRWPDKLFALAGLVREGSFGINF